MKRLLALLLVVLLTFAACGGTDSATPEAEAPASKTETSPKESTADSKEDTPTPAGDIKISLFQSKVEITDQLEKVAADYTESTGVEVEVWGAAGDDYRNQLQARMASGEGPVMFSVGGEVEFEQFSQYVADLSDQPYTKNISPGLALEKDGKTYGVPFGVEGFGLIINTELIKEDELKDFDSLAAMFQRLDDEGKAPLILSSEDYFLIAHILNTPFALQEDYHDFLDKLNAGEVSMADTPEFQEFARIMELIRDHSINPLEVTYDKQIATFADGDAGSIHQGNWAYGMFEDYDVTFDMTMVPLPLAGNDKISIGVGGYWCVNSEATQEQQAAAHDFYNFLLGSKEGYDILMDDFGFIPPFADADYTTNDPLSEVVFAYSSAGDSLPWTFPLWPQGIIEASLAPATQGFFSDPDMDGTAFLESLDEAWASAA